MKMIQRKVTITRRKSKSNGSSKKVKRRRHK